MLSISTFKGDGQNRCHPSSSSWISHAVSGVLQLGLNKIITRAAEASIESYVSTWCHFSWRLVMLFTCLPWYNPHVMHSFNQSITNLSSFYHRFPRSNPHVWCLNPSNQFHLLLPPTPPQKIIPRRDPPAELFIVQLLGRLRMAFGKPPALFRGTIVGLRDSSTGNTPYLMVRSAKTMV